MKSRWVTHKNKQIWLLDYSAFKIDKPSLFIEVEAAHKVFFQQPKNSMLVLIDITNTMADLDVVNLLKARAGEAQPYIRKTAILGVTGVKKILAESVIKFAGMRDTAFFDDDTAAKDWLVA